MAVAAKEKESAGMDKAELKKSLILAKRMPMNVAFALGGDGKVVLIVDKVKKGPKLREELKGNKDTKEHRFGMVRIDEDNPKLCIFTVNKGGGGYARKLIKAIKGTGFTKVILQLEDGSVEEQVEEEDEEDNEGGAQLRSPEVLGDDDQNSTQQTENDTEEPAPRSSTADAASPSPAAGQQQNGPDAASLTADLAGLIKQMIGVIQSNPAMKAELAELATDAQVSLKRGELEQAAAGIEILRQTLADGSAQDGGQETNGQQAAGGTDPNASDGQPVSDADMAPAANPMDGTTEMQTAPAGDAASTDGQNTGNGAADPNALMSQLTELVKRMLPVIAADPSQQDTLRGIAQQAQAGIKGGDHDTASEHIETLRSMLDGWAANGQSGNGQAAPAGQAEQAGQAPDGLAAPTGQAAAAPNAAPAPANGPAAPADAAAVAPTIAKARSAWIATRQKVEGDLGKLHAAFGSAFKGHDQEAEISKAFQTRLEKVLNTLDEELAQTLESVNKARDANERTQLVQQAHALLAKYQQHVASDDTIAALDSNPFVPMSVQKTLTATISALSRSIR